MDAQTAPTEDAEGSSAGPEAAAEYDPFAADDDDDDEDGGGDSAPPAESADAADSGKIKIALGSSKKRKVAAAFTDVRPPPSPQPRTRAAPAIRTG